MQIVENIIANLWNRLTRLFKRRLTGGLVLGKIVADGRLTKLKYFLPQLKRAEHLVILGKTGQGKSFLILFLCLQDIRAGRGLVIFDPHDNRNTLAFLAATALILLPTKYIYLK